MLDRNKRVFELLLKDMAMKSLVLQLMLMVLVMVWVEICARGSVLVYCNNATGVDMQDDALTGVKQYITC